MTALYARRIRSRRHAGRLALVALGAWGCTPSSFDPGDGVAGGGGSSSTAGTSPGGSGGASGSGGAGGTGVGGTATAGAGGDGTAGADADAGAPEPPYMDVPPTLTNPNATASARRLMHFLTDSYGHTILAGQQEPEYVEALLSITGKEPAVLGLDLIDYSPSRVERGEQSTAIEDAIAWHERGGIVTFAWHWNAPSHLIDEPGREWWRGFYTDATTFDIGAAVNPSSEGYQELLRDIDAIAVQLRRLADADVPVLFRPLHEASGAWFWWGARGPEPYLALWGLLHDRLTLTHGLNNLIWVWNGQNPSWYPGDATVDIVSEDIYATPRVYSAEAAKFRAATAYPTHPKLVALSENGALPDPDALVSSGAAWSWFCGWSGAEYMLDETWNEDSMKRAVYAHDYVTTFDELPDLSTYPLP